MVDSDQGAVTHHSLTQVLKNFNEVWCLRKSRGQSQRGQSKRECHGERRESDEEGSGNVKERGERIKSFII
jgi:hypothetical protein